MTFRTGRLGLHTTKMVDDRTDNKIERYLARSSLFLSLIFLALLLAFFFVASSLCITIIASSFLAILVDPLVIILERLGIGRTVASGIVVLCGIILVGFMGYGIALEANSVAHQIPAYSIRIHRALDPVIKKAQDFQWRAESIEAQDAREIPVVRVQQSPNWPSFFARGVGSITGALVVLAVVPFLTFFMLIRKQYMNIRFSSMVEKRFDVPEFIYNLNRMIRGFIVGNLIVSLMVAIAASVVFLLIGMRNAMLIGIITAILNIIPFLGLVMALAVGLLAALAQFTTVGPFVAIFLTILVLHTVAANMLTPKVIGSRLRVGPVAVVVGMLFWGWLWGAFGLLLAIPLTAFLKLVADSQPSLIHLSNILSETPCPPPRVIRVEERSQ